MASRSVTLPDSLYVNNGERTQMKIACDTGIARVAINALEEVGHEVVYWAGAQPDEWWFPEAVAAGATLFVSHDWDIINMAMNHNLDAIRMQQGIRGVAQAKAVLDVLAAALRPIRQLCGNHRQRRRRHRKRSQAIAS